MATKKELEARVAKLEREVGSTPDAMVAKVQAKLVESAEYGDAERMKTREGNLKRRKHQQASLTGEVAEEAPEVEEVAEEAPEAEEAPVEDETSGDPAE